MRTLRRSSSDERVAERSDARISELNTHSQPSHRTDIDVKKSSMMFSGTARNVDARVANRGASDPTHDPLCVSGRLSVSSLDQYRAPTWAVALSEPFM